MITAIKDFAEHLSGKAGHALGFGHHKHGEMASKAANEFKATEAKLKADAEKLKNDGHGGNSAGGHGGGGHGIGGYGGEHDGHKPEPPKRGSQGVPGRPIDPDVINHRMGELAKEGHATGRHSDPDAAALQRRLGDPKTDANGNIVHYGPNSPNYPGHVKPVNCVDPLTGTTTDGVTGNPHKCGPYATKFDNPEDMVRIDAYCRKYIRDNGHPPTSVPISVLGPSAHTRFSGYYRDPANPTSFLPVDFQGGSITPVYRQHGGHWNLHTMFPNPAHGRHP